MSFLNLHREIGVILEKASDTMSAEEIYGVMATFEAKARLMLLGAVNKQKAAKEEAVQ